MNAYESPIHELSYAVLLVSILKVFFEIWQDDYHSVGDCPWQRERERERERELY